MKETPEEIKIHENLKAGVMSKDGFLGDDERHFHEIIKEDKEILDSLGIDEIEISKRMRYFTDLAFEHYDGKTIIDSIYEVEYVSVRGKLPCPFKHSGGFNKGLIRFRNLDKNQEISWTPLNIHMIEKHCFFEGKGSKNRLEPEILYEILF